MKLTNVSFCAGAEYCHAKYGPSKKWTGSRMIVHVSVNLELDKIIITVHAVMMSTIYEQEVQCHFELLAFLSTVIQKPTWNQSLQFVH